MVSDRQTRHNPLKTYGFPFENRLPARRGFGDGDLSGDMSVMGVLVLVVVERVDVVHRLLVEHRILPHRVLLLAEAGFTESKGSH